MGGLIVYNSMCIQNTSLHEPVIKWTNYSVSRHNVYLSIYTCNVIIQIQAQREIKISWVCDCAAT